LLAALLTFVVLFQVRASLQTVHLQRTLDFYVPFLLKPFTSEVAVVSHAMNWEQGRQSYGVWNYSVLRRGDRLIAVNGRPFSGMSVYLRELWDIQHQRPPEPPVPEWKPFVVTVLARDGNTRTIEFGFPHCTCGVPALWQALALWLIAPLFCVLVGFATAALRPSSRLAWAYLGLMLSVSQLQFWQEPYTEFQITVTPMLWADWFRVPAVAYRSLVQNAWPAFLLIAARQVADDRQRTRGFSRPLIAAFLSLAALKAALAVAWSEGFRMLSPLYDVLDRYRTELLVLALLSVAACVWTANRRAGTIALLVTMTALAGLFWSPAAITEGEWTVYSDQTRRFEPVVPEFHHTHELILVICVALYLLTSAIVFHKSVSWRALFGMAFGLPLATQVGASVGNYWYPFAGPSFEYWPWLVLASAGAGIVWIALWIVRRESSARQPEGARQA
jgi:hypothetical protein